MDENARIDSVDSKGRLKSGVERRSGGFRVRRVVHRTMSLATMNYLFDLLLFLHMLGLAMSVGAGFSMRALRQAAAELPAEERTTFMIRVFPVSKVASWGLLLLIVSGVTMLALRFGSTMAVGGAFHLKLLLVVIQIGLFGYTQMVLGKIRKGEAALMAKMPTLSTLLLGNALLIVAVAVLAFH